MHIEPIFCYPALDDQDYLAHLSAVYSSSRHPPEFAAELTPAQTAAAAEASVRTRLDILQRVYAGDYFTDSFDIDRLARRVREEREFIWFWGRADVVSEWLAHGGSERHYPFELGTVSIVAAGLDFDPGTGEICRSGSTSPILLKPYAVKRIIDFLSGGLPSLHAAFHTLFLVPRARASGPNIRGGKSVNTIHRKYIRSRFWGFAPWYVMQGDNVECLEYREVNRSLADLYGGIRTLPSIHLANEEDRMFAQALFGLNLPRSAPHMRFPGRRMEGRRLPTLFEQVFGTDKALQPYNHRTFRQIREDRLGSPGVTLDDIETAAHEAACTVIDLDISTPASLHVQAELADRGYRLTNIRPPRLIGSNPYVARGSWARPNPRWRIAPPYYSARQSGDAQEQIVLHHLTSMLGQWTA